MKSGSNAAISAEGARWRRCQRPWFAGSLAGILCFCSDVACAYVGPGSGLSTIGALLAVFGAILFGIVGLIWYPFKRLIQFLKRRASGSGE
jgi:hypothetical protein